MSMAIIGIGLPGSGKTTVLKPLAERYDFEYVNRDDIREELLGSTEDQSKNKVIWEEANQRTARALGAGKTVVLDSTFVEGWKRREMVDFARENGATHVIGIYFDVPADVAKERNQGRDRVVNDEVIDWMLAQLAAEPPAASDGFDALLSTSDLERLSLLLTPDA